jgi:glycosyltransferase involved in cell wall biosynthesis
MNLDGLDFDRDPGKPVVAHLIHLDGPGGGPISFLRLLGYFHQKHTQVAIAGGKGRIYQTCLRLRIPFYKIPIHDKKSILYGFWALVWRLWKLKPDLLILHGQWAGPVGALAAKLAGVRKIIYIARWPAFYTSWDLFRLLRNFFSEYVPCKLCDRTITLSESSHYQYLLRQWVPDKKLLMIPNAVIPEEVPGPEQVRLYRKKYGWTDDCCHVVSVGRLSTQKRLDWLLKSWQIVHEKRPQARLWIVGNGPLLNELKEMAQQLNLEDSCTFMGEQFGLLSIASSDIVAMTTLYESRGNVAMEALLCRRPIVASMVDGVCDTVRNEHEGFLVPPGYNAQFAERLIELIDNPELREQMGSVGSEQIGRFRLNKVMKEYDEAFNDLLKEE